MSPCSKCKNCQWKEEGSQWKINIQNLKLIDKLLDFPLLKKIILRKLKKSLIILKYNLSSMYKLCKVRVNPNPVQPAATRRVKEF